MDFHTHRQGEIQACLLPARCPERRPRKQYHTSPAPIDHVIQDKHLCARLSAQQHAESTGSTADFATKWGRQANAPKSRAYMSLSMYIGASIFGRASRLWNPPLSLTCPGRALFLPRSRFLLKRGAAGQAPFGSWPIQGCHRSSATPALLGWTRGRELRCGGGTCVSVVGHGVKNEVVCSLAPVVTHTLYFSFFIQIYLCVCQYYSDEALSKFG